MKRISLKHTLKTVLLMTLLVLLVGVNKNYAKAADGQISAVTIKTGKEDISANSITGKMVAGENEYVRGTTVAVKTDCSGLLRFHVQTSIDDILDLTLYSDEALTKEVAYTTVSDSTENVATLGLAVPKAGTYYLQMLTFATEDLDYTIAADIYSADDQSLTSGKSKIVTLLSDKDSNYYTIKLNQAGTVKVSATYANETACYTNVDIYQKVSGKMKLIAKGDSSAEGYIVGLAKGTYYIKLSGGSDSYYAIKYTFTAINDKSGATKAKAASLKLGTASKGVILYTDKTSKADWYKLKLTKDQAVTITFNGDVTGIVSLDFYDSDNSFWGGLFISSLTPEDSAMPYLEKYNGKSKKLPKGTYYIKITKDDSKTSGSYSVKIK